MSEFVMRGPVEVELKVCVTDGERFGVVTIGMGMSHYPTQDEMQERVRKFAVDELESAAPGFHLCDKAEYWEYICHEKAMGQRLAMPGGREFDPIN
jgi:hypothetical protein